MANLPTSIKNLNTLLGEQLTEGGGGSSDFSTATVTIVNNASSGFASGAMITDGSIETEYTVQSGTNTVTVVLYQGAGWISLEVAGQKTVSGNIVADDDIYTVSGDGSITIANPLI